MTAARKTVAACEKLRSTIKTGSATIVKKRSVRPPSVPQQHTELADDAMFAFFRKSPSVQARCDTLRRALERYGVSSMVSARVVRDVFDALLVPAGVKSHTRGMLFNEIVGRELRDVLRKSDAVRDGRYELSFETRTPIVSEIPDWTIRDADTGRLLIGFNQIDLWSGGHQLNRGGKYVLDDRLHRRLSDEHDARLLAVVAQELPTRTRRGSKVHRMRDHAVTAAGPNAARLCMCRDVSSVVSAWMNEEPASVVD